MVSSEFGRRVAQNGTGCDHGHRGSSSSSAGSWPDRTGQVGGFTTLDNGDVPEYTTCSTLGSVMKGLSDSPTPRSHVFPSRDVHSHGELPSYERLR